MRGSPRSGWRKSRGWSSPSDLFARRAIPGEQGRCFEWPGARDDTGYGTLRAKDPKNGQVKTMRTHVISYEMFVGPIPEGQLVRHSCDNPPCWNPDHLLAGTYTDNLNDAYERSRRRWRNVVPVRRLQ